MRVVVNNFLFGACKQLNSRWLIAERMIDNCWKANGIQNLQPWCPWQAAVSSFICRQNSEISVRNNIKALSICVHKLSKKTVCWGAEEAWSFKQAFLVAICIYAWGAESVRITPGPMRLLKTQKPAKRKCSRRAHRWTKLSISWACGFAVNARYGKNVHWYLNNRNLRLLNRFPPSHLTTYHCYLLFITYFSPVY